MREQLLDFMTMAFLSGPHGLAPEKQNPLDGGAQEATRLVARRHMEDVMEELEKHVVLTIKTVGDKA
jgi:hypothetical protein